MLQELDALPPGLLDLEAPQLEVLLGGPTLIHLPGRRTPALFVSVLMHGNETTGWAAVRDLLRTYAPGGGDGVLPRAVSLFVGNVSAAAQGVRRLDGQPDSTGYGPAVRSQSRS